MKKINFKKFKSYEDISHSRFREVDICSLLSSLIYKNGTGVGALALAIKIYKSADNALDYDEKEIEIMKQIIDHFGTPLFIDSFNDAIK